MSSRQKNQSSCNNLTSSVQLPFQVEPLPKACSVEAVHGSDGKKVTITYNDIKIIGSGSFGVVYSANLADQKMQIAIKKVLQDKRFKNRELEIMRQVKHDNIVFLHYFFYSSGDKKEEVYLNLVLEFVPETVYRVLKNYNKNKLTMPLLYTKLYVYQLLRALHYIHLQNICHRDIKPQNLLVDPETGILKLCDFGSAKILVAEEPNVSYICSRYYRAPELIFGATNYTCTIDVWSAGCVMAELLLGHAIFPGESGVDQLVEIIKILGTPTSDQIVTMNPNYTEHRFPNIAACDWEKVFRARTPPSATSLVSRLLVYIPTERITCIDALAHPFFAELRDPDTCLPNGKELPISLFKFTSEEITIDSSMYRELVPKHVQKKLPNTS